MQRTAARRRLSRNLQGRVGAARPRRARSSSATGDGEARALRAAGVDFVNHNLNTSRRHYPAICTTHTYDDRVATARLAIDAGMELCCGGILGMGETLAQRIDFAFELAELEPCEVPINLLDPRPGTPLGGNELLSPREALQAIALFRLVLPSTWLRLAGGREKVLGELQAMEGVTVIPLVGRRAQLGYDPLGPGHLVRIIPDLHNWEAFICGPEGMAEQVESSLRELRMPKRFIHREELSMS